MKNIRNILAKGVFMLLVSLLAMACTEKSDWGDAVKASDQKVCSGINVVKMRYPHVCLCMRRL